MYTELSVPKLKTLLTLLVASNATFFEALCTEYNTFKNSIPKFDATNTFAHHFV
jgi:hypothetical protein